MRLNGRSLAALAVGVVVGAGVSIPAAALAQGADRPESAQQPRAVDSAGSTMGEEMGAMMSMMDGMSRAGDGPRDGPTREDMERMARMCAQMMENPGMQRMHNRMMDDSSGGMDQMRRDMMGGM